MCIRVHFFLLVNFYIFQKWNNKVLYLNIVTACFLFAKDCDVRNVVLVGSCTDVMRVFCLHVMYENMIRKYWVPNYTIFLALNVCRCFVIMILRKIGKVPRKKNDCILRNWWFFLKLMLKKQLDTSCWLHNIILIIVLWIYLKKI